MRRKVVIELTIQTGQSDSQAQRVFHLSDDYCPILCTPTTYNNSSDLWAEEGKAQQNITILSPLYPAEQAAFCYSIMLPAKANRFLNLTSSSTLSCSQAQEELDLSEGYHTNTWKVLPSKSGLSSHLFHMTSLIFFNWLQLTTGMVCLLNISLKLTGGRHLQFGQRCKIAKYRRNRTFKLIATEIPGGVWRQMYKVIRIHAVSLHSKYPLIYKM
jgi:hypothetical protein